ncbi:MAG: DUF5667 domain-containing protein [Anaerolineales bacterium]
MKMQDHDMNRDFEEIFEPLRHVPARDEHKSAVARSAFLSTVEALSAEYTATEPVSETTFQRLNGWISGIFNPFRRKERFQMFSILTALVVAVTIVFGGAGATAYAAQDSLPDQALYPVKLFSEDMRLNIAVEPQSQIKLLLNYTDRRVNEMAALLAKGEPVSQQTQERFQEQMASALKIAAGLDGESMVKTMATIQLRANNQLRIISQVQPESPGQGALMQQRVQALIREQLRLLEQGIKDPQQFMYQYQNEFQHQFQYQQGISDTITGTLPVTGTFGTQNQYQNQFQHQFQYQQGISGTITGTVPITDTPGLQYGPYGPAGDHYQPGPNAGPGAGPGPGGEDGGSDSNPDYGSDGGNEAGPGEPDHDQDAYNSGDNDNAGGSDNGGNTDSGGSADSGGDSGGGGDTGGGSSGGGGGGGGGN